MNMLFCCSTKNYSSGTSAGRINSSYSHLDFSAIVDTIMMVGISEKYRFGINYKKEMMLNLPDTCELLVGHNAYFQLSLTEILFKENCFNLKKANLLKLHIHSPTLSFFSTPETGKRYEFSLGYQCNGDSTVSLIYLTQNSIRSRAQ